LLKISELNDEIDKSSSMLQEMLSMLQDPEVVKLLEMLHNLFQGFYLEYADTNRCMSFDQFVNICRDFNLFPDLASKSVLHRVFHSLSSATVHSQEFTSNTDGRQLMPKDKVVINDKLFIEAIALCAFQCKLLSKHTNPLEKILHIAEKMMQSPGISKVRLKKGKTRNEGDSDVDPLIIIRKAYGKYLLQSVKEPANFDNILTEEEAKE
jgi:hypothetical protein